MNTTLAIVGSHPRTCDQFDMSRADCDVWLFNEALSGPSSKTWAKRADAVFQMHVPAIWKNPKNRNDPGHAAWLQSGNTPVIYMQQQFPEVPMAREYPLQGVLDMLEGDPDHFLSSSVAQAIALAIYLGTYDRIEIYGVAMESNTEYTFQREGVAFWKGYAMGRGIKIFFADDTYRVPIYGFEGEISIPYARFDERIAEIDIKIEPLTAEYRAKSMMTKRVVADLIDKGDKKTVLKCLQEQTEIGIQLGKLDGAKQENQRYKAKADEMRTASGGEFVFSRQEFETGAANRQKEADQMRIRVNALSGQLDLVHDSVERAAKGSPKRRNLLAGYQQLLQQYLNANNLAAVYMGAAEENFAYMAHLDKTIKAAGGAKSEAVLLEAMQRDLVQS